MGMSHILYVWLTDIFSISSHFLMVSFETKFFIVMTSGLFLFFFSSLFLAFCPGMCG